MQFTMTVDMDNAAFDDFFSPELERLFSKVIVQIRDGRKDAPVIDSNGNTVGTFEITS